MPANMYVDWIKVYQQEGEGEFYGPGEEPVIPEGDWEAWTGEGGVGTFDIQETGAVVTVSDPGVKTWSIQLIKENISLPDGDYTLTFRAKSDDDRSIQINMGKGLNVDPWFVSFMDTKKYSLTNEWQSFSLDITKANSTYDTGKLVFEIGNISGGGVLNTTVYLDQISLDPVSGTSVNEDFENGDLTVFPNPASEAFYIESSLGVESISVFNVSGNQVFNKVVSGNQPLLTIGCADWKPGVYMVFVSYSKGHKALQKLIVY
ncbi:MAG: carbohydrate binding domain-containing protein [Bacteroidetes bacterium]|nr:carbohydrate binding domain-containing protein [Bacteroidota bacterium]